MSAHPETRYLCDRCEHVDILPMYNGPPPQRLGGPDGWLQLAIGTDPSRPPAHLCPNCKVSFETFMKELRK